MKIITYSDLHLEFGTNFKPPKNSDADLMILSGDIITFKNFKPLSDFLSDWDKPVLYVAGNHEYYTRQPMDAGEQAFKDYISEHHSNITWLNNSDFSLNDIHFFGGTMWTDFNNSDPTAIQNAWNAMNDFSQIIMPNGQRLTPYDTIKIHENFKEKLEAWLEKNRDKKRVIISHHSPVKNPNTKYEDSNIQAAFNSLDMLEVIEKYQPDLWVYGHTHECDNREIGKTRIISNQMGYPRSTGDFECMGFDSGGMEIKI
ncbi:MAG: metallophosphoesterase [Pseudomonadota bacterium]